MKYYSIPADFKLETIDAYASLNQKYHDSKVAETYGNITVGNILASGRSNDLMPVLSFADLKKYVEYSQKNNIEFNYTLNASHLNNREFSKQGVIEITKFLHDIYEIGIRNVTVALPSLIELIKFTKLDFRIKASTICEIKNSQHALGFKDLGIYKIVCEESINYDFKTLRQILEAFGEQVELIVNADCFKYCIYRMFHYNQVSSDSVALQNEASPCYYSHRCLLQRLNKKENLLKMTWIRPEDIKHYNNIGIKYFKLQGRQSVLQGNPIKTVETYFKEQFDGNLLDLLHMFRPYNNSEMYLDNRSLDDFMKPFINKENFCIKNCEKCKYCSTYANKCIDDEFQDKTKKLTNEFHQNYDPFVRILGEVNTPLERNKLIDDIEFDV